MTKLYNTKVCKMIPSKSLEQFLQESREALNLTRKELASHMNAIGERLHEEEGIPLMEFSEAEIELIENGLLSVSDDILGFFSEALGIPWEELMERDTRLNIERMADMYNEFPGWATVFNTVISMATQMSPEEIVNRLAKKEDYAFSEEIILANRSREHELDKLPPEEQVIILDEIYSELTESWDEDKPHKIVSFDVCFGGIRKEVGYHLQDEDDTEWEEGFNDEDEVVLPYLPKEVLEVYNDNILSIVETIYDKDPVEVRICGTGNITYKYTTK